MIEIGFVNCRLRVWHADRYLETVFTDGTKAPAAPEDNDAYRRRAIELGYGGSTWDLCLDHEPLHTWMSECMGLPYSLVLWETAHGNDKPKGGLAEEGYVMAFQRFLRCGTTDDMVYGFLLRAQDATGRRYEQTVNEARTMLSEVRWRRE